MAAKVAGDAALNARGPDGENGPGPYVEETARMKQQRAPDPGTWCVKAVLEGHRKLAHGRRAAACYTPQVTGGSGAGGRVYTSLHRPRMSGIPV